MNNNNNNILKDDDDHSIHESLRQIETRLEETPAAATISDSTNTTTTGPSWSPASVAGRTGWASLGSALSNLRSRFQSSSFRNHPPSPTAASASTTATTAPPRPPFLSSSNFSERLRVAELAHSTHTPLSRLRQELERRRTAAAAATAAASSSPLLATTIMGNSANGPSRTTTEEGKEEEEANDYQQNPSTTTTTTTGRRGLPLGGSSSEEEDDHMSNSKRRRKTHIVASRRHSLSTTANTPSEFEDHQPPRHQSQSQKKDENSGGKLNQDREEDTAELSEDARLHQHLVSTVRVLSSNVEEETMSTSSSGAAAAAVVAPITEPPVMDMDIDMDICSEKAVTMDMDVVLQTEEETPETNILLGEEYSQSLEGIHRSVLFRSNSTTASSSIHLGESMQDDDNDNHSAASGSSQAPPPPPTMRFLPQVYSWGATIHSLYDTEEEDHHHHHHNPDSGVDKNQPSQSPQQHQHHLDEDDLEPIGPSSRIGRTHVVGVATSIEHSAVVTNTGNVYTCGVNRYGAVDPSKSRTENIPKPTLLESLTVPVLQVSCGYDHTAAVTTTGTVLTWGSDKYNQLGHRRVTSSSTSSSSSSSASPPGCSSRKSVNDDNSNMTDRLYNPRTMALGQRRAAAVACGDGFTLVLTSRMQVLVCGKQSIVGYHPNATPSATTTNSGHQHPHKHQPPVRQPQLPTLLPVLFGLPITNIAAGQDHAVVVTCHGTVFSWGDNSWGQCGQEYPLSLPVPVPMRMPSSWVLTHSSPKTTNNRAPLPPVDFAVVRAACGSHHTILVTTKGQLLVCGKNDQGQLGIPAPDSPAEEEDVYGSIAADSSPPCQRQLEIVTHPESSPDTSFVTVVAGTSHTLALDSDQNVWKLSHNGMTCVLRDRWIVSIAAGGTHSVAVTDIPRMAPPPELLPSSLPQQAVHRAVTQLLVDANTTSNANTTPALDQLAYQPAGRAAVAVAAAAKPTSSSQNAAHLFGHSVEDLVLAVGGENGNHVTSSAGTSTSGASLSESAVRELANRAEELLQCPAVMNGLFLDPVELDLLYQKVMPATMDRASRQRIANSIERGMFAGLQSLETDSGGHASLKFPESVRFLLLYLQCPLFLLSSTDEITFDRRGDLMLLLCEHFLGLSYEGYRAMVAWITSMYARRETFVKYLIQPLLKQLERGLESNAGPSVRVVPLAATVLKWLYITSDRAGGIADAEDFWSLAMADRDPRLAFHDLYRWKKSNKKQRSTNFFLCNHSFLFSPTMKRNLLAIENEVSMVHTATRDGIHYNREENCLEIKPYWVLEVDREDMLKQTLKNVAAAKSTELRKKLKVVFRGEEGIDAGGVTREFFQLLSAQLFDIGSGMWSDRFSDERVTWFNPDCFWNDEGYYLVGILVGLAVYNSVLLDVHFPSAIFRKLLGLPLGLEDMVDSRLRQSLEQLLSYEGDDVEDIFCLNFSLTWMDLGTERTLELKPGGEQIPVTSQNKEEYVRLYVKWHLEEGIHAQYDGFERGFMKVMENATLDFLSPEELELLVVGSPELDFDALEEKTTYEGYEKDDAVIQHLWSFLRHAEEDTKLQFLKFTTGSSRAPIGGLGKLQFKIQKNGDNTSQLPTSHTCFNTLLLPNYGDNFDQVADRMGRAVLECEGFGLQ